ncbi:MAG: Zn-ribbon containing protein [Methanotrichaceae archaeon]
MPHICTRCNNIFGTGDDILKGCPVCGWRKFMFVKEARHEGEQQAEQVINQSMGVRRPPKRAAKDRSMEGLAEVSAKGSVKRSAKEAKADSVGKARTARPRLHSVSEKSPIKPIVKPVNAKIDDRIVDTIAEDKTPVAQVDDKLESIKITAPGTYELNLPSLFERDELIMAVKEGTYFIDLSSAFRKGKKE